MFHADVRVLEKVGLPVRHCEQFVEKVTSVEQSAETSRRALAHGLITGIGAVHRAERPPARLASWTAAQWAVARISWPATPTIAAGYVEAIVEPCAGPDRFPAPRP